MFRAQRIVYTFDKSQYNMKVSFSFSNPFFVALYCKADFFILFCASFVNFTEEVLEYTKNLLVKCIKSLLVTCVHFILSCFLNSLYVTFLKVLQT